MVVLQGEASYGLGREGQGSDLVGGRKEREAGRRCGDGNGSKGTPMSLHGIKMRAFAKTKGKYEALYFPLLKTTIITFAKIVFPHVAKPEKDSTSVLYPLTGVEPIISPRCQTALLYVVPETVNVYLCVRRLFLCLVFF